MSLTDLPLSFWGYALETAAFTLNRAPSKSVETTPYEIWFGKNPNLSFLKIWGCDSYVKKLQLNKLKPKSEKCVFVGYPRETAGYSFYHKTEGKLFVAKNGVFLEKEFLAKGLSGRIIQLDEVIEPEQDEQSSASPEVVPETATAPIAPVSTNDVAPEIKVAIEPRRSGRIKNQITRFEDKVLLLDNDEPTTYKEAMMGPDSVKWQEAMKSEIESMYENQVWNLIDPLEGVKPICDAPPFTKGRTPVYLCHSLDQ
jgi:hypothetical protein